MYRSKELRPGLYVLSLDNHVEIAEALGAFCRGKGILAGEVRGLGAISEATFRFLDPATKKYVDKCFSEQMEITNLTGNISSKDGEVYLHLHITASRRDYTCVGGHLLSARINGACELFVEDYVAEAASADGSGAALNSRHATLTRRFDPETGLNLYDL